MISITLSNQYRFLLTAFGVIRLFNHKPNFNLGKGGSDGGGDGDGDGDGGIGGLRLWHRG